MDDGRETGSRLCVSCKIAGKKCEDGVFHPPGETVVVQKRPAATAASATVASTPKTRLRKDKGKASTNAPLPRIDLRAAASTDADRFPAYDLGGARMGTVFAQPAAGSQPSLSRKRSALAPPSEAGPSSSKSARTSGSSSHAGGSSIISTTSSRLPPSIGSSFGGSQSFESVEDPLLMRLDALEMSLQHGNVAKACARVKGIRKWHTESKGEGA